MSAGYNKSENANDCKSEKGMAMVTLKDVAAQCGVSPATVSRALNNAHARTEKTKRIRQTADRMGYRPNANARALKTNRSRCVGIIYEGVMRHEYFSSVIDGIRDGTEQGGYDLCFLSRRFEDREDTYISQAGYRMLDGVIVVQADFESPRIRALASAGIPVVCIDGSLGNGLQVESDNVAGMEALAEYVLSKGHRRVAYVKGEEGEVTRKRYGGFCAAFEKRGLDPRTAVCFQGRYRASGFCLTVVEQILRMEERPTCVFFPDDFSCAAGIALFHERGIRVPEDISVTGYDGIEVGRLMYPRLTTYRQETSRMAETAVRMLLEAIGGRPRESGALFTAEGCLIPGETVREI